MLIKGIIDEDFVNYRIPSMFINTAFCDFKCEKESGVRCCQNSDLAHQKCINLDTDAIIQRYLDNHITRAICFGGLEPFEQYDELLEFVAKFRNGYDCNDPIVIYTGYNKTEISFQVEMLRLYGNIIIKFGRFIPNQESHYDEVLGVNLASLNQYAEKL